MEAIISSKQKLALENEHNIFICLNFMFPLPHWKHKTRWHFQTVKHVFFFTFWDLKKTDGQIKHYTLNNTIKTSL